MIEDLEKMYKYTEKMFIEAANPLRELFKSKKNNHNLGIKGNAETDNKGTRHPSTVQYFQQKWRRQDQLHPTQKPIELIEWLINSYSDKGDTILDMTAGSMTTGIACINTNRKYILMENDAEIYDKGLARLQSHIDSLEAKVADAKRKENTRSNED